MYQTTKYNVLVRIDKLAQKVKQSKTKSGILIPDQYKYMEYNLQYGEIIAIGTVAQQQFPEMEVGDVCIFHHTIEDGEDHLVDIMPNKDEIRYVDGRNHPKLRNFQIFGVQKPEGYIIPSPWFIFLDPMVRKQKVVDTKKSGLTVDQEMWDDEAALQEKITELAEQKKSLEQNFEHFKNSQGELKDSEVRDLEPTIDAINSIEKEQKLLTKMVNRANCYTGVVNHIHEATAYKTSVMPGDRIFFDKRALYPMEFDGNRFLLLLQDQAWAIAPELETTTA